MVRDGGTAAVFTEMAPGSSSFGTRLGTIAWPAGAQKARPTPNKAAMKNEQDDFVAAGQREPQQCRGRDQLESVWRSAMMSRRSKRSAICPPGRSSTTNGRNCASPMSPR